MEQEHLQKVSKRQWYRWSGRWHRTIRLIVQIAKTAKYRPIQRSRPESLNSLKQTTTCTASCNFHFAEFAFCSSQTGDGSSHVCAGGALCLSEQDVRQWCVMVSHHGNDIFWRRALLDLLLLPWLLLTVIICTNTFQKADIGWHWYQVSVLARS